DFRLQHVKSWNCSRFKTILLVLQLAVQQVHRFLLNFNELSVDHYLVELRFHSRDELVQNIAEREIGAVPLKEGTANRWPGGAVKDQLSSKNADAVGNIALIDIGNARRRRSGGQRRTCDIPDLRRR